jgi:hypothetical protein
MFAYSFSLASGLIDKNSSGAGEISFAQQPGALGAPFRRRAIPHLRGYFAKITLIALLSIPPQNPA